MRDEDIHIGDKLRVRLWDDIIKDQEIYMGDDLFLEPETRRICLGTRIKYLSGKPFTVSDILSGSDSVHYYISEEGYEEIDKGHWYCITSEMLERDTEEEWDIADDNDIKSLLT